MTKQVADKRIWRSKSNVAFAVLLAFALLLSGCVKIAPPTPPPTPQPTPASTAVAIHVFDVGEGLAVLIDDGEVEVIIDGGYKQYGIPFSKYIRPYVDGDIEYVIATHSHSDHVGGLAQIYSDYQVDHTVNGDTSTSQQYLDFENAAKAEPNSDFKNDATETIALSEGVSLSIIDVIDIPDDAKNKDANNNSVISLLEVGGVKTLITGDAESETEKLIQGLVGAVDIYVVGHHGSETSSSQGLLNEIKPKFGIISSQGPNKGSYNNPDIEVLKRLDALGTVMYATYRSGTIVATIDGGAITLSPPQSQRITPSNYKEAA